MSGDPSKPDSVRFTIREYGYAAPVSESMAAQWLIDQSKLRAVVGENMQAYLSMSKAERAAADAAQTAEWGRAQAEREAKRKAMDDAAIERWSLTRMSVMTEGVLRQIVELHKPTQGEWYSRTECDGCRGEVSGYEYDMEEWPCATFLLIEESL